MKQKELIKVLVNKKIVNPEFLEEEVIDLTNDSRTVQSGSCFIAIRGSQFDGHSAVGAAVEQGAQLVIVEEVPDQFLDYACTIVQVSSTVRAQALLANVFYNEPSTQLNVVAVTGTNGKTTISNMISQLLEALGRTTGVIGTLHYKIANQFYPPVNTTPNSLELQHYFHQMVIQNCSDAIIEASSHALALGRLWYTDINCAIFTNLTREHLDFHHTMEKYAFAKSLLFSQLGQRLDAQKAKLAILNLDDAYSHMMSQVTGAEIVTYSLENSQATAFGYDIVSEVGKTKFILRYQNQDYPVEIPMRGQYNVSNFLASFLCLTEYYQYLPDQVIQALAQFEGVSGRMQSINLGQPFEVIVDFAHTTDALERVLNEIKASKEPGQEITVVMGHSGGNRDSAARPDLGDILFKYADKIIFTADNPRHEPVHKICQEMIGAHQEKPYEIIEDRRAAIELTINQANDHDIILFAGKGGEPYQVIGDEYQEYNEVEIVKDCLQNRLTQAE